MSESTTTSKLGVPGRDWWWLATLCFGLLIMSFPLSSYSSALPIIRDEWRISDTQAGVLNALSAVGSVVGSLVLLPLTDRLRADRVLIISGIAVTAGQLLFPLLAHSVAVGALLRLVAGVGVSGVYATGTRVVAERFSQTARGAAVGVYVTIFYLGGALSFVATGALLPDLGWRGAWILLSATTAVTPLICWLTLRGYKPVKIAGSSGRLDPRVLRNPSVAVLTLGYFMHSIELGHARTWLAPFLAFVLIAHGGLESSRAVSQAALIVGVCGILGSLSPILGGMLSDRVGRLNAAMMLFGISAACSFAIGWMGGMPWWTIIGLTLVYSVMVGADSAIYSSGVTEVADPKKMGSTLAVQAVSGFLGAITAPILFGVILDLVGRERPLSWGIGFATGGVAGVITIVAMLWVRASAAPLARRKRVATTQGLSPGPDA